MANTDFSTWDFANFHVQQELSHGQFVSAETSLVAAGPPELGSLNATSTSTVYPIGLIENAGLSQSKQLQKIFEIGSSRSYFVPGRVIGSVSLGRMFYYGPSLLRVMYAYYTSSTATVNIGTKTTSDTIALEDGSLFQTPYARLLSAGPANMHQVRVSPGEDHLFINLASDLFNQPTGLAFYFKDANFNSVGAFFLENVYVQGHQFSISSGSVLVMEGASAQYDRALPIKLLSAAA